MDKQVSTIIPKSLNSLYHRSIIEKAINIQHWFFLPPCPDYTSAASILLNVAEYLFIDQPLYIDGITTSSIGATISFNLERLRNIQIIKGVKHNFDNIEECAQIEPGL